MRWMIYGMCCWLGWGVAAHGSGRPFDVKPWRALEDRNVSRLGRAVMRGGTHAWIHAESETFTYHAATRERLESVAREAEWTYAEVSERLGLSPASERGHLFVVEDEGDWTRVMRAAGRRADGVALHVGREIFILRDGPGGRTFVDIPHEMVHYRLWQQYGRDLPLWLEEGLAEYLGWQVAIRYQRTRQLHLYRERSPVEEQTWIPWTTLFEMERYPADPRRTAAFYRQSGGLVGAIAEKIGEKNLGPLVQTIVEKGYTLKDALAIEFDLEESVVDDMLKRVEQEMKQPAERLAR